MAPFTVQQSFGLKPEELNALTVLAGLEGYRGPNSLDPAAVAASTLLRRVSGKWGGRDIRNIATAPGQFASVLDRGINMQQLGDPAYGAKLLGGQSEFNRIQSMINDPSIVGTQMQKVGESFRALSEGPKPGDYIPVPGKSNFYFNQNPAIVKRGLQLLGGGTAPIQTAQAPPPVPQASVEDTLRSAGINPQGGERITPQGFLDSWKQAILSGLAQGSTFMTIPTLGGL
jgi:hypothetical protein